MHRPRRMSIDLSADLGYPRRGSVDLGAGYQHFSRRPSLDFTAGVGNLLSPTGPASYGPSPTSVPHSPVGLTPYDYTAAGPLSVNTVWCMILLFPILVHVLKPI